MTVKGLMSARSSEAESHPHKLVWLQTAGIYKDTAKGSHETLRCTHGMPSMVFARSQFPSSEFHFPRPWHELQQVGIHCGWRPKLLACVSNLAQNDHAEFPGTDPTAWSPHRAPTVSKHHLPGPVPPWKKWTPKGGSTCPYHWGCLYLHRHHQCARCRSTCRRRFQGKA